MSLYIYRYEMRSAGTLNSASSRETFNGALVRVGDGFGCLHPWPELGDAELEEQLIILESGGKTPLIERMQICAAADGAARREGRSLFDGLEIPESHYSLPGSEVEVPDGFAVVKVKLGENAGERMRAVAEANPGVRLRGDFNGTSSADGFVEWAAQLSLEIRGKVDFVEDPFAFDAVNWALVEGQTGISLAIDRKEGKARWPLRVMKPAVEDPSAEVVGRRVVTSYMDHPLGQMFAAWCAAADLSLAGETHGLVTQHLFEPDVFTEILGEASPNLVIPEGAGLGFGELLESLPWKKLC